MGELGRSMKMLVDRPPAAPPPVEVIAANGVRFARRRRTRRVVACLACTAVVSIAVLEVVRQSSEDRVVLAAGGRTTGAYIAAQPGGYVAAGSWAITITRGGQTIELSSTTDDDCGRTGVILPGDVVRGSITGERSTLRVGEQFTCPDE